MHWLPGNMAPRFRLQRRAILLIVLAALPLSVRALPAGDGDQPIRQFLANDDPRQHPYRAVRQLEAENGSRTAWLEAVTEYSDADGFRYKITGESGSSYLRNKVLRPVLDGEREALATGEVARSALVPENYTFQSNGVDDDGLAQVLLSPRRKERILIAGAMFVTPQDGWLVRVQGQLAKSPSLWVKRVDIVKRYERLNGVVLPVALDATAQTRLFGTGTLRMTYTYTEIDGRPVNREATPHGRDWSSNGAGRQLRNGGSN